MALGRKDRELLTAEQEFARLTIERLRPLAALLVPDPPKKKGELVATLTRAMTDPVRILLVDDHAVLRSGLRLLLEREEGLDPVGEAETAEDAVRSLPRLRPDVVVIDVEMPGMGGIDGASRIKERAPETRVLVLSMHDRAQDVRRAFDAGADGYLPKAAADEDLVRAIRAVAAGERYVHPSLGAALAAPAAPAGPIDEFQRSR